MKNITNVAAILAVATGLSAAHAYAGAENYEFQIIEDELTEGAGVVVSVKLINKRTGALVEDAVIFASRMDMAPEGMEAMTSPVEAVPSDQPGIYRFKTDLVMAGGWRISLAAKVQGESGTVVGRLPFEAVP